MPVLTADVQEIRNKAFIDNYITNGHNSKEAYKSVYKCKDNTAMVNGSRKLHRLIDTKVFAVEHINREEVEQKVWAEAETAVKAGDRLRALELMSKLKGLLVEKSITATVDLSMHQQQIADLVTDVIKAQRPKVL